VQGLVLVLVGQGVLAPLARSSFADVGLVGLGRPVQRGALVLVQRIHLDAAVEEAR
jgi:hypothetical protein